MRLEHAEFAYCDCGKSYVERWKDKYKVQGPFYNADNMWLICNECGDKIQIGIRVQWTDVNAKGLKL